MTPEEKIKEYGYRLPEISPPKALYIPVKRLDNALFVSGQIPFLDDKLAYQGKVGDTISLEQAQEAARICILNLLSAVRAEIGELDKIRQIVKVQGFVNSRTGFDQQHIVMNAASQFLFDILGERGRHARTAVGTNQLPLDVPVEIEAIIEI